MLFKPSVQQLQVFEEVRNSRTNIVIDAKAGSGKTTTLIQALPFIPPYAKVAFFAFNKSIVQELEKKTNSMPNVNPTTLHSFGFSAVRFRFKGIKLNADKYRLVIKKLSKDWVDNDVSKHFINDYCQNVLKLCDLARYNLVKFNEQDKLEEIAARHDIDLFNVECMRALELVKMLSFNPKECDFTDMIYLAATQCHNMKKFDWVIIDEAQDLNKAQQAMVRKILKPRVGRMIAVGDPNQAIYGFAGADVDSFNNLQNFSNTKTLPLSVCYRCGTSIIKHAQSIVQDIKPFNGNEDGEVREGSIHEVEDGDWVLCRNNAPLVKLCLQFLRQKRKAYVKGADIGTNLISLIDRQKCNGINKMLQKLPDELERIKIRLLGKGYTIGEVNTHQSYRLMQEKIEIIDLLINDENCKTIDEIKNVIKSIFKDDSQGICLSSIHRSKGGENDNIFIIEKEAIPSKYAKQPWQKDQEHNLQYVMITRAKKKLIYVNDWQFYKK